MPAAGADERLTRWAQTGVRPPEPVLIARPALRLTRSRHLGIGKPTGCHRSWISILTIYEGRERPRSCAGPEKLKSARARLTSSGYWNP